MGKRIRGWLGLDRSSSFVQDFVLVSNIRAAIYMAVIVIVLESWMLLSLARLVAESAAAGRPRDLAWIASQASWYVVLLLVATAMLIHAIRYLAGKVRRRALSWALLVVFSIVCIVFGIRFGLNSYLKGEQVLAFVTMSLFVFGILVWPPIWSFIGSIACFGCFFTLIDAGIPASYGMQVNLFTLWISTFVVALAAWRQKVSEANKSHKLVEANTRLQWSAEHDELTRIPNMNTFRGAVRVLLEGTDELGTHFSIIYFDIENFRYYNERMGFAAGDELLKRFAAGLVEIFPGELVARLSDDHFVAFCETRVVEERVEAARQLVRHLRGDVRLHLKAGTFEPVYDDTLSVSSACDKARIACNSIKHRADRVLQVFDDSLATASERRQHVISNVKRAVSEGWVKVFYQPVVSCAAGDARLVGYEALARWQDPEFGLLPPFAFIETLEEYREIDRIDRCIIEQVCRDLRRELDEGNDVVPVSLNFSRLDFELFDVPAFLQHMSETYDVPPRLLDVEITESALTDRLDDLRDNMARLRDAGFSLWLDDFGSGYSSLNVLKDFDFDVLKIDMAFLRGFPQNPKAGTILAQVTEIARALELTTLCEGVETLEQFEFLNSIGCDRAQGYYFGKPEPKKATPASI